MRFLPHLVWIAGLFTFVAGFVVGPGIPYQDPTPEMRLREAQQFHLAGQCFTAGFYLFVGGVALTIIVWLVRRYLRRSPTSTRTA